MHERTVRPDGFERFHARCLRNLLRGTALSVIPAGVYYLAVFPFSSRQILILTILGILDIALVVPLDLILLRRSLAAVAPVFQDAGADEIQAALKTLVDLPRRTVFRVFGPHAITATAGITLLILIANRWFSLGIPVRDFPMYWLISLALVPIAHAVYEFTAMERAVQRVAESMELVHLTRFFHSDAADEIRFGLNERMRVFFGLLAFAPMLLLLIAVFNKAELHAAAKSWSLLAIPVVSTGLILFLIVRLSDNVDSQIRALLLSLDRVALGDFAIPSRMVSNSELGRVSAHINRMSDALAEKEKLRGLFGTYMTPTLADELLREENPGRTERRFVALMFVDVRGFTAFSAAHPAETVLSCLNRYLEVMVDCVAAHNGMVNKYLGDGLLAIFGAPVAMDNPSQDAVAAAIEISRGVASLAEEMKTPGLAPLEIGIGIHCGEALVGSIGTHRHKMEYTAIGDTVNLASRIEQLTKSLRCEILVSEEVARQLDKEHAARLGPWSDEKVKGLERAVRVRPLRVREEEKLADRAIS